MVAWEKWNKLLIRQLKQMQLADGSIPGQFGPALGTSMSLLAIALELPLPADLRTMRGRATMPRILPRSARIAAGLTVC